MFDFNAEVQVRLVQDKIQGLRAEAEQWRQLKQARGEQREERRARSEARQAEPALNV